MSARLSGLQWIVVCFSLLPLAAGASDEAPLKGSPGDDRQAVADEAAKLEAAAEELPDVSARPSEKAAPGSGPALYLPPPRSSPQGVRLIGAGTRRDASLPRQVPIAPDHVGLTELAQPTLYWYSTGDAQVRVDFVLMDIDSGQTVIEVTQSESITEGYHELRLAEHGASLAPGVTYRWYVMLVPDPADRSADLVSAAGIRFVEARETRRDWAALARGSVWYDAVDELFTALPADSSLVSVRAALFSSVGLPEVGKTGGG